MKAIKNKKYYALAVEDNEADIFIFGDIVSWEWLESDVSSYTLAKEIEGLDVDVINVFINSYGGEVAEGLAIYNQLRRHKATVKTYCDGFACSAASVVFMAGDERIMSNTSLLMIHNAWNRAVGDYNELQKVAEDLKTINQASVNAYLNHVNITEEKLKEMMDAETWIAPADALEMGFATSITDGGAGKNASQSVKKQLMTLIVKQQAEARIKQQEPPKEPAQKQEPEPQQQEPPQEPQDPVQEPEKPQENKVLKMLAALTR